MSRLPLVKLICYCLLLISSPSHGQQNTVSPQLYKKLQKSEQLIATKAYSEAFRIIQSALTDADSEYEAATVLRSLSSIYALQENYRKAAEMLSKSLALNVFPGEQQQQALLNLGQLYMATEQYRKALDILEPWLQQNRSMDTEIMVLVANAYTQLKQYRKALPYIQQAIKLSKKPAESWYQLNLALHYELRGYNAAAGILKTLIRLYPDKNQYWDQLASVYQQIKQFDKAASIKQLAYKKGLIESEKQLLELFNLLLYIDAPYKAAVMLDREIQVGRVKNNAENQQMLAHAWTQAREFERAITALEIASKLSDKGMLYQQMGQILVEQEKWQQAVSALSKAVSKGGLKQSGNVYLLLGMSYFEMNQLAKARQAFSEAGKYNKTKSSAVQWLQYIDKQQAAKTAVAN